jgi:hypothetical protein
MNDAVWVVQTGDGPHVVEAHLFPATLTLRVHVDGAPVLVVSVRDALVRDDGVDVAGQVGNRQVTLQLRTDRSQSVRPDYRFGLVVADGSATGPGALAPLATRDARIDAAIAGGLGTTIRFETRPRRRHVVLPALLALAVGLAFLVVEPPRGTSIALPALIAALACALGALATFRTRIVIAGGRLEVSRGLRPTVAVDLAKVREIHVTRGLRRAPTLELTGALRHVRLPLGAWDDEATLLALITAGLVPGGRMDAAAADVLATRPVAAAWGARQPVPATTAVGRRWEALPLGARVTSQLAAGFGTLVILSLALSPAAPHVPASGPRPTVTVPDQPSSAWQTIATIPATVGDTWPGNAVRDGNEIVVLTREDINGFWGTLRVRSSFDNGASWPDQTTVSGELDAARPSMVDADGNLTFAWSQRGPVQNSQRLVTRQRNAQRHAWLPASVVAIPAGGLVGRPALAMTESVQLVVFTDGQTGEIWAVPLRTDATAAGEPVLVGQSNAQLYSDSSFSDGLLSLTTIDSRAVLAYVDTARRLHVATSDDNGLTWEQEVVDPGPVADAPQIATLGRDLVLAVGDPGRGEPDARAASVRIWRSPGGQRWTPSAEVFHAGAIGGSGVQPGAGQRYQAGAIGSIQLSAVNGRWQLLATVCPGAGSCTGLPSLLYASSGDGSEWTQPEAVSPPTTAEPIAVIPATSGIAALWAIRKSDHDWTFLVSVRPGTTGPPLPSLRPGVSP